MDAVLSESTARDRFSMFLLACIGLSSVIAESIEQRAAEFGIRMALGADFSRLRNSILHQALALTATGIALGLAASLAATRLIASLLYGVRPHDPLVFASVTLLMFAVAIGASLVPADRILRIDPYDALRSQ